ncbi:MAG: CPBP family intramembrane glutamic endopeptidase [Candidatus Velthaea sp.]|jgi:membrane protease YdiL (CAAX protease family)
MSAAAAPPSARTIVTYSLVQAGIAFSLVAGGAVPLQCDASRDLTGIALGTAAGIILFYLLAYDGAARPLRAKRFAIVKLAALLAVVSVAEEIVWRGYALAALRATTGPLAALAATSLGFAAAHATTQGWTGIRTHLVTGAVIGLAFILTRSLAAAVATHLSYNLMFVRALAPQGRFEL